MKKISAILLATGLLTACQEHDKKVEVKYHDLKLDQLNGDITAIQETPYKTDSTGKPGAPDSCCSVYMELDANGNYIRYTEKDNKDSIQSQTTNTHYPDGMFKGYVQTKKGKPASSLETMINDKGEYTMAIEYDSTGKTHRVYKNITQNENAQVKSWKEYDTDSVFHQEATITYDKGLQQTFVLKDSVGKLKNDVRYTYNDKGELSSENNTTVTKDSTTKKMTQYTYDAHDEKGNWTQRTELDEKGKPVKIVKRVYTYKKEEKN